ncbi:DUF4864 domain-containing protein [Leptolyngbya sp. FACHB-261]|uniref:DUF4864 domain-containing protein n=1 Tax=Leptolyngbya sp. FACHB-261 TaxID=2692806 RepID=UPI001686DF73|nr:DUF4864 domain-containing protein [Leptolyngbya sp. FACHB-261]MBD2100815.1 DUF4864 domain-containing protein [Leptolyngbya sp. FACHB-261]
MPITDADRAAIRSVIQGQLEAFGRDDSAAAFAFASPEIQDQFRTPGNFIRMVKTAYQPVYRPRSVLFEDLTLMQGFPTQQVLLLSAEGKLVMALYLMQKQINGGWRIAGCQLMPRASDLDE